MVLTLPQYSSVRMDERIAVNFRSGRDKEARFFVHREAERLVRAERADFQGLNRQLQIINRAGGRREMPDEIHRPFEKNKLGNVLLDELEIRIAAEVRDVVHAAGDKIVNADDLVAARNEEVGQVRAEKTGSAGDDGRGLFLFQNVKWLNLRRGKVIETIQRFNHETMRGSHFAPVVVKTAGMVRSRILTSSQSDQLSMYSRSSRTQSLKSEIWLRP